MESEKGWFTPVDGLSFYAKYMVFRGGGILRDSLRIIVFSLALLTSGKASALDVRAEQAEFCGIDSWYVKVCYKKICSVSSSPGPVYFWFDPITLYDLGKAIIEAGQHVSEYNSRELHPSCSGDLHPDVPDPNDASKCEPTEICGNKKASGTLVDDNCDGVIDEGCGNCDNRRDSGCCVMHQGSPANVQTGNVITLPAQDLVVRGAFGDDIVFTRVYDSGRPHGVPLSGPTSESTVFDSYMGEGWNHTFQYRLEMVGVDPQKEYPRHALFYREDGRPLDFHFTDTTSGTYARPSGRPLSIAKQSVGSPPQTEWLVEDLTSGEKYTFDGIGRLKTIKSRVGKGLSVTERDSSSRVRTVQNDSGQRVRLVYWDDQSKNLLKYLQMEVSGSFENMAYYQYDTSNRLETVTYLLPSGSAPTGYSYMYGSSSTRLEQVKRGTRLLEKFSYYTSSAKAMTVESEESRLTFTYDYTCPTIGTNQVQVTGTRVQDSKNGRDSCIAFDAVHNLPTYVDGDNAQCGHGVATYLPTGHPLAIADDRGVTTFFEYEQFGGDQIRLSKTSYGTYSYTDDKRESTYFKYPATCGGSGVSCYAPDQVLRQGALQYPSTICNPATGAGCLIHTFTYDATTWEVTQLKKEGKTYNSSGSATDFCDILGWSYASDGRLQNAYSPLRQLGGQCPNPTTSGYQLTYHSSGRLDKVIAKGLPLGDLELASFSTYDGYGNPSQSSIGGIAHTWTTDPLGDLLSWSVGGKTYTNTYHEGRLLKQGFPEGNYLHYELSVPGSDIFQRLTRLTRTGTNPSGTSPPAGSEAMVLEYDTTGMLERRAFHRLPTGASPGVLDRAIRMVHDFGRPGQLKLETGTHPVFEELSYNYPTACLQDSDCLVGSCVNNVCAGASYQAYEKTSTYSGTSGDTATTSLTFDNDKVMPKEIKKEKNTTGTWATWEVSGRDNLGHVTEMTDPHGRKTALVWDDGGQLVKVTSPDSGTVILEWDAAGHVKTRVHGSKTASYAYDSLGRPVTAMAGSETVSRFYDGDSSNCLSGSNSVGRLCKVVTPCTTTTYQYNTMGLLARETSTYNATYCFGIQGTMDLEYGYNDNGTLDSLAVMENGDTARKWTIDYQSLYTGQANEDPDMVKTISLDHSGLSSPRTLASAITQRSFLTDYTQLSYGFSTAFQNTISYSTDGHISSETYDSRAWTTDNAGRLKTATATDTSVGRMYNNVSGDAIQYDRLGQLKATYPASVEMLGNRTYTYDDIGNRGKYSYVYKGTGGVPNREDEYKYPAEAAAAQCQTSSVTTPSAAENSRVCEVHMHHDPATPSTSTWTPGSSLEQSYQSTMDFIRNTIADAQDPDEMQERFRLINNELGYFLKDQGIPRVIFFRTLLDDQSIRQQLVNMVTGTLEAEQDTLLDIVLDAKDLTLSDALSGYENGIRLVYQYDTEGRLLAEGHYQGSTKSWDLCYIYDDWGNLSKMGIPTDKSDPATTCTAILAEYRYDHRGRRVATRRASAVSGYSFPGQVAQVSLYDDSDRLTATASKGSGSGNNLVVTRQYLSLGARPLAHLQMGHMAPTFSSCQLSSNTGRAAAAGAAIWLLLVPVVMIRVRRSRRLSRRAKEVVSVLVLALVIPLPAALLACTTAPLTPAVYFYHPDATLLPVQVSNENGEVKWQARYDDSGAVEREDLLENDAYTPLRFPGQQDDGDKALVGSLGPYYNHHRYYDPMIGRYTTADPLGLWGGENLYSYAGGDPINKVDPTGAIPEFADDIPMNSRDIELRRETAMSSRMPIGYLVAYGTVLGGMIAITAMHYAALAAPTAATAYPTIQRMLDTGNRICLQLPRVQTGIQAGAMSRKKALERLNGQVPELLKHINKLMKEPNSQARNHWLSELNGWIRDMEGLLPALGRKTASEWQAQIDAWKEIIGGL